MYYIIETEKQFKTFANRIKEKCFVEIITNHDSIHPIMNNICLVYIHPLNSNKGYIVPVSHNEAFSIPLIDIVNLIAEYDEVFVRDKKFVSYFLPHFNLSHIPLLGDLKEINSLKYSIFNNFYNKYQRDDINKIIPISKHYERCEDYYKIVRPIIDNPKPECFNFYNEALEFFRAIEYPGIQVNIATINAGLNLIDESHSLKKGIVYTQYSLDNTTKRPSNHFNGVNFAAIPKNKEHRSIFIPRNNKLIEIDIDSYHPTIIADYIGYDYNNESMHQHLAKIYNVDYNKSKEITFKQLYGGIFDEYKNIEFFHKTQKLIDKLWDDFNKHGFIKCPISQFCFEKNKLDKMNPQKLFNYWVQNIETSQNILIIKEIISILKNSKSKLVLYTYDAFLLDMDENESHLLYHICNIFLEKKLKYKIKYGDDYWSLKTLHIY